MNGHRNLDIHSKLDAVHSTARGTIPKSMQLVAFTYDEPVTEERSRGEAREDARPLLMVKLSSDVLVDDIYTIHCLRGSETNHERVPARKGGGLRAHVRAARAAANDCIIRLERVNECIHQLKGG